MIDPKIRENKLAEVTEIFPDDKVGLVMMYIQWAYQKGKLDEYLSNIPDEIRRQIT